MADANTVVGERLGRMTPGEILSVLLEYKIYVWICRSDGGSCLARTEEKSRWEIVIKKEENKQEMLIALIHEFAHLILIIEKLDIPGEEEKYDDRIVETATIAFFGKYPNFARNFWDYLVLTRRLKFLAPS